MPQTRHAEEAAKAAAAEGEKGVTDAEAATTGAAFIGKEDVGTEGIEQNKETAEDLRKKGEMLIKEARTKGAIFKHKLLGKGKDELKDMAGSATQVQHGYLDPKKDKDAQQLATMGKQMMEEAHKIGKQFKRKAEPMMKQLKKQAMSGTSTAAKVSDE